MPLHLPRNKDAGSFSKAWQNNFWQVVLTIQKTLDSLIENFIGTTNDINSKRAFLPHDPWVFFELVASTTANGAVTITRKLGQRVIDFAVEELNVILAGQVFSKRPVPGDRIKAGTNITVDQKLGEVTINASSGGGNQFMVITNGDPVTPEIIFDGDGDVVLVEIALP